MFDVFVEKEVEFNIADAISVLNGKSIVFLTKGLKPSFQVFMLFTDGSVSISINIPARVGVDVLQSANASEKAHKQ